MEDQQEELMKVVAVMSVPMCGWNPHWGCSTEAMRPFGIPIELGYGAFWHQSMQCLLEAAIVNGMDWVLTLDYDSMFTAKHLDRLIGQFGQNPQIDALAALQCKRGTEESPLMTRKGQTEVQVTGEPIQVDTAHFGLTLFRTEALKRMPKPWFVGIPAPDGSYGDGRTDADIYFWHKWKEAGNTAFVDPLCSIGHIQPRVVYFDDQFQPEHCDVFQWRKREASK